MTVPDPDDNADFEKFRADIDAAERKVAGEIDPGARAMLVAVLVFVLAGTFALPHAGAATGFDVLTADKVARGESIALPSQLFLGFTLVFGVLMSTLALVTRRWALAWIAVAGSAVASVFGVLAIWSRQTLAYGQPGGGPGIGLIVAAIVIVVLTFHWVRVVWSRTAVLLAAEEQRRIAAAEAEQRSDWRNFRD